MARIAVVYYAICTVCGPRGWSAPARALDTYCDACGRAVDHWQPTLERQPENLPARPATAA